MEYKFTKEGKKVAVIGKINSQQFIVQEIFISNGQEIPMGENFVVTSLLDNPVKSWKETNLENLENNYEKNKKEIERKNRELRNTEEKLRDKITEKLKIFEKTISHLDIKAFEYVSDFLTDKFKFVVIKDYRNAKIDDYNLFRCTYDDDRGYFESFKLITLMGKTNGDLSFNVNRFSDGSGHDKEIFLYKTIEEAKNKLIEINEKNENYNSEIIQEYKKYNIKLNEEKYKKYIELKKINIERDIEYVEKEIKKQKEKLKELKNKKMEE